MPESKMPRSAQAEAATAALNAVLSGRIPLDELILNDFKAEYIRGNQYNPGGWLHAPANLEVFSATLERIQRNGAQRGITGKISKVRAAKLRNRSYVYIYATSADDPDGIEIHYLRTGGWINLISLLGPLKSTETTGYRSRYAIEYAGADSPVGPALVLDLGHRLERRKTWREKNKARRRSRRSAASTGIRAEGQAQG